MRAAAGRLVWGVQLQGATLDGAQLESAELRHAQLQGASLKAAGLQGAWLDVAELQGASLDGAQLQVAELRNAQLQGASLENAHLQGAALTAVFVWRAKPPIAHYDYVKGALFEPDVKVALFEPDVKGAFIEEPESAPKYQKLDCPALKSPCDWSAESYAALKSLIENKVPAGSRRDQALKADRDARKAALHPGRGFGGSLGRSCGKISARAQELLRDARKNVRRDRVRRRRWSPIRGPRTHLATHRCSF